MRKIGLQLVSLQSEAELEIERITDLNTKLSQYQDNLEKLLNMVPSPEDRVRTLSIMIESELAKIKKMIGLIRLLYE